MTTIPTLGFNVETVQHSKTEFNLWDVGSKAMAKNLWQEYTENVAGVIFVIDSNDSRVTQAQSALQKIVSHEHLQGARVLVFANKQDLPKAATPPSLVPKLKLENMSQQWYIQGCSAASDAGLKEGLEWLSLSLKSS